MRNRPKEIKWGEQNAIGEKTERIGVVRISWSSLSSTIEVRPIGR